MQMFFCFKFLFSLAVKKLFKIFILKSMEFQNRLYAIVSMHTMILCSEYDLHLNKALSKIDR